MNNDTQVVIGNVLQLSTGHIPGPRPDFHPFRWVETEYGWIFWPVDPDWHFKEDIPPWLAKINSYAYENDCVLVEFDNDSSPIELFESFDW